MELIESVALQRGIENQQIEDRIPYLNSYDVLLQFLMNLAVGSGFQPKKLLPIIKQTFCFQTLNDEQWQWIINFLVKGSQSLEHYDEYKKVNILVDGSLKVINKRIALRHRLSMGTIVSDANLKIRYQTGGYLGTIEEWFIAKLKPGDVFTLFSPYSDAILLDGNELKVASFVNTSFKLKKLAPAIAGTDK